MRKDHDTWIKTAETDASIYMHTVHQHNKEVKKKLKNL